MSSPVMYPSAEDVRRAVANSLEVGTAQPDLAHIKTQMLTGTDEVVEAQAKVNIAEALKSVQSEWQDFSANEAAQ